MTSERGATAYDLLDISSDATLAQARRAYLQLALATHPDRGGDACQMARLNDAFAVLSNPASRRILDAERAYGAQRAQARGDPRMRVLGRVETPPASPMRPQRDLFVHTRVDLATATRGGPYSVCVWGDIVRFTSPWPGGFRAVFKVDGFDVPNLGRPISSGPPGELFVLVDVCGR